MDKTLEKLCEEAISLCIHTRCNRCEYGGRTLLPREGQRCQQAACGLSPEAWRIGGRCGT